MTPINNMRSSILLSLALGLISPLLAQSPGVKIESGKHLNQNQSILDQAEKLQKDEKLPSVDRVNEMIAAPVPRKLELPAVRTQVLPPKDIYSEIRKSYVRVGWFFLCTKCDHWHLNLGAGYAIDNKGAIATCDHCIRPGSDMREGYLIAVDQDDQVFPVASILATDSGVDAAIIQVDGGGFTPLPLQDQISPGESAYLFSEPLGNIGYFSSGMVNRFYYRGKEGTEDEKALRMNVSTDWAPGSSGAAIVDACGNAIGHVSTIAPMVQQQGPPEHRETATVITLHEAIPARAVKRLLSQP